MVRWHPARHVHRTTFFAIDQKRRLLSFNLNNTGTTRLFHFPAETLPIEQNWIEYNLLAPCCLLGNVYSPLADAHLVIVCPPFSDNLKIDASIKRRKKDFSKLFLSGGCCGSTSKKTVVGGWAWAWWLVTDVQRLSLEVIVINIIFVLGGLFKDCHWM